MWYNHIGRRKVEPVEYIFEIEDRDGVPVRLCRYRWERHIKKKRPWMSRYLPLIKQAIVYPEHITTDKDWDDCFDYYIWGVGRRRNLYLMVVVQYYEKGAVRRGWVRTAFLTAEISRKVDRL
jgi:hypothetical protein